MPTLDERAQPSPQAQMVAPQALCRHLHQLREQLGVASHQPRVQESCGSRERAPCVRGALVQCADHGFGQARGDLGQVTAVVQHQQLDLGVRGQLAATVCAERYERHLLALLREVGEV
jgi:hypothetical protein